MLRSFRIPIRWSLQKSIKRDKGGPCIKEQTPLLQRVGIALQGLLQREYGDVYELRHPPRTVETAKKS